MAPAIAAVIPIFVTKYVVALFENAEYAVKFAPDNKIVPNPIHRYFPLYIPR